MRPFDERWIRQRQTELLNSVMVHSDNTVVNYESSWRLFEKFCAMVPCLPLPVERQTVIDYIVWAVEVQGYRTASVQAQVSAVRQRHVTAGFPSPTTGLSSFIKHLKRVRRERPCAKDALRYDQLLRAAEQIPETLVGVRDRSMILLAFASGWRRSEVVALSVGDIQFCEQGVELFQAHSKTDQHGEGRTVGIHRGSNPSTCPVRALEAWLALRGKWDGPLFVGTSKRGRKLTTQALHKNGARLYAAVKQSLKACGEDASRYGAHSLRSGMITEAVKSGASEIAIQARTGHKSIKVLRSYIRPATAFDFNPLAGVL